ncbi:MAG TPA: class I SAM-dependent methyltransferase [Xanthobacteraceae bacterium]|nr:class I SAM-dependent methyltransferase [Xanthobacteraceae bacterium]
MNVQFNTDAVRGSVFAPADGRAQQRCLFLLTPSKEECGVESFARLLVSALQNDYPDDGYAVLPVSSRWRDLPAVFRKIAAADQVVFSVPMVAWKRLLLLPLVVLVFARMVRSRVNVFMHEWSALHWLRRLALAPFVLLSRTIIVVSPFIAGEIAGTPWLMGAARKCRLVPNAPTIRRPVEPRVTECVLRVREAAKNCDVVIGYFGAIYKGKAATALLDVCDNLRNSGIRAGIVFIGSFMKSLDGYEQQFWSKVAEYGIADQVVVTGYISDEAELHTLFDEVGAFLFLFPEGLTARRSSVIHTLQSDRPVVVTAPRSMTEFAHHAGFTKLIEAGILSFVPERADLNAVADQLLKVAKQGRRPVPAIDWNSWWRATTAATHAAMMDTAATNNRGEAAASAPPLSASGRSGAQPQTVGSTAVKILAAKLKNMIRDGVALALFIPALPFLKFAAPRRATLPAVRELLDRAGVTILANHYHEPTYGAGHIFRDPDVPRVLAGIDWNIAGQTQLLAQFDFGEALRSLEGRRSHGRTFSYSNGYCGPGDAEALYCMIRHFKPRTIVEVGCGQSTVVAHFAIEDLKAHDSRYSCRQICYEPYENPWLEDLGVEVKRELIEKSDLTLFRSLSPGDIVFIDSSHALRPMGDVEFEFLHILPNLPKGVIVQVHDIFSPRDYPAQWLNVERRFWNEQYLLEAFLSFNDEFEIVGSLNHLMHMDLAQFKRAFPVLAERGPDPYVGSFWFRRVKD